MPPPSRYFTFFGIGAVILVLDQWTKHLAIEHLIGEPTRSYLADTFRLVYAPNRGAFLSLGDSLSPTLRFLLFTVGVGILLLGLSIYALRTAELDRVTLISWATFIFGGVANWIDRARFQGVVVDFMNIGIGPVRTAIFNIADVAVMAGIGLLIYKSRGVRQPTAEAQQASPD